MRRRIRRYGIRCSSPPAGPQISSRWPCSRLVRLTPHPNLPPPGGKGSKPLAPIASTIQRLTIRGGKLLARESEPLAPIASTLPVAYLTGMAGCADHDGRRWVPMKMQANRIAETIWEIPTTEKTGMLVPARIYATEHLFNDMDEAVYDQITNVATLPGITKYAMCMPDGHSGYGFPIGGGAPMDVEQGGVISPGGVGFDINCGMRLVVTNLT